MTSLSAGREVPEPIPRGAGRLRGAAETVLIGCTVGLLTGTIRALVLLTMQLAFGRLVFHGRGLIWMAPLGNALVFSGVAIIAASLSLLLRVRIPAPAAVAGFAFLAVFALLVPFQQVAPWATALLALAVAVQLARRSRSAPERWRRRAARTSLALSLVVLTLGLGQRGVLALRRAAALRALPPAKAGAPNVLLVIWDTVRGEELSLYGYPQPTTPSLEQWAARGVVFDQAIATAPWTLPSHGSLFTGELAERLGGGWLKPITSSAPTLAEALRERGYRTGGFAANLLYTSYESGLSRGFIDYQDYPLSLLQVLLQCPILQTVLVQSVLRASSLYEVKQAVLAFNLRADRLPADEYVPARVITDRFLRWQGSAGGPPFFAFLNYFDAHAPYRSPAEFQARFATGQKSRGRYDASIAYLDSELDRLLGTLANRGALERTIVILSSDHGELFGEHDLRGHANALYLPLLRVPLVLLYPARVPGHTRVADPVSLRDVPATILDLTGAPTASWPGASLVGRWDPAHGAETPSAAVSQVMRSRESNPRFRNDRTELHSLLDERYHYIRSGLGLEELYDWRVDSLELKDLARDAGSLGVLVRLREGLERERGGATDRRSPASVPR